MDRDQTPSLTSGGRRLVPLIGAGVVVVVLAALLITTSARRVAPPPPPPVATTDAAARAEGYAVWARNDDGSPLRWDPCSPIVLIPNLDAAYPGAAEDLAVAVDLLASTTGLELHLGDPVDEQAGVDRPATQRGPDGWSWSAVLIAWIEPGSGGLPLRSFDRGLAVPVAAGEDGARVYVTGQIVFNAARDDLVPGFGDRADAWGSTLLHELMHLLGLDHVDDPTQLMWTFPGEGPVELGDGDRAGLRAVGAAAGCLPVPPAEEVVVRLPDLDVAPSR